MDVINTLFIGDMNKSSNIVTLDQELKTLKNLVNVTQNYAWQFNTVNNIMWAFGRYGDAVLEHALKLFIAGTLPGYIYKNDLLDDFLQNYDFFIKELKSIKIIGVGEERVVFMKLLNNYDIKHIVRTIVQYLQKNRNDEICKFITINLCNGDLVDCNDMCDDVLLLINSVNKLQ